MKNTNTLISIQLDTLADLLEWDIKQYEKTSRKVGNLYEASDQIRKTLGKESASLTALEQDITTLNTECDYWCERCDKNFSRYEGLISEMEDRGETYIPERGPDWMPNWISKDDRSSDIDPIEPTWDAVSRHDSNEGW